jgi:serine/threonine protein kinase
MTPERFRQIRNLFDAALERDAALRTSFLAEACQGDEPLRAEVGRLLAAHLQEASPLDGGAVRPELLTGEPGRMEGRRIDHYEILRALGRGGMGAVYLALRTDDVYRKSVAFKVVRPEAGTPEVIQRFRREREILASLDHPNLARLLDGGTTPEGLPYFVMDFVEGQPIDTYCDDRQLNVAERLKLFRAVCAAVEYAHGSGVVHRDLKPGNILVTAEGVVKLLDFGIAKLLRSEAEETAAPITLTGMRLMTPEYASPEQVRGEAVGTASDVYSLGVVLYELLTGHRPYRMRSRLIHEVVRVICEEEPTRPSTAVTEVEQRSAVGEEKPVAVTPQSVSRARAATPKGLRRQLSGDPDKIILKALRKDPAQRYRTAEAFGEDVGRHLDGLPVLAQGESVVYRAGKFLQRYRGWAIALAVLSAGLATGAVKVNFLAVGLLLAFLLMVLGGYLANRRELGRDIASRDLFPLAVFSLILLAGLIVVTQLPWRLLPLVGVVLTTPFAIGLARWPLRARWAGRLLRDITPPKTRGDAYRDVSLFAFLPAIGLASMIWKFHDPKVVPLGAFTICAALFAGWGIFCCGRMELRDRGIMYHGAMLRWSSVESYAWQNTGGELVMLKMRKRGVLPFGSTLRLSLPAAEKDPTDAILKSQLAEWPGS